MENNNVMECIDNLCRALGIQPFTRQVAALNEALEETRTTLKNEYKLSDDEITATFKDIPNSIAETLTAVFNATSNTLNDLTSDKEKLMDIMKKSVGAATNGNK